MDVKLILRRLDDLRGFVESKLGPMNPEEGQEGGVAVVPPVKESCCDKSKSCECKDELETIKAELSKMKNELAKATLELAKVKLDAPKPSLGSLASKLSDTKKEKDSA